VSSMPVADSSPAEVVHVQQAHGVAEMLIPVDREVHPPLQGLIGFVVEKPVQGGEGSVELRHQSGAVEHHGTAERPRSGIRPKDRTNRSSNTTMFPNSIWNSSCWLFHLVPRVGRRRSLGEAVATSVWNVPRASSISA
jgi:hypothetical protein